MALTFPRFRDLSEQARAELRRRKPEIDPTVFASFARPFMDSAAVLAYAITLLVRDLVKQLFPQGAEGEFLERWGGYENLERTPATAASGEVSLPGTVGTTIPGGTVFTSSINVEYTSDLTAVIQTVAQSVASITRSGTTATVTTASDHSLATGLEVTISGANETAYNGTFEVIVTARDQFTYTVSGSPSTPATGTISASSDYAVVSVTASVTGDAGNLAGGATLSLASAISGADDDAIVVQFGGISGGADVETDDAYRERILLSRSIQEGVFTADQIQLAALSVPGNTRAFVIRPSLSVADPAPAPGMVPAPGQVVVYVLRDNDANIFPSSSILATTKQAIIDDGALPANTYDGDVFVFAPTPVTTDFTFSAISPDTPTMRTAIRDVLSAFFQDVVDFEEDVTEGAYLGAIQNTQDQITGDFLQSFTLSSPSGDISVSDGEIAVLGTVTFP